MKEYLIPLLGLGTCFRDGLYVSLGSMPTWLLSIKSLQNPLSALIVIPKERKSLIFSFSSEKTCPRCLCFLHPSLPAANISLQDTETSCFPLTLGKMLEKTRPMNTDHTCCREQVWNQPKKSSSEIQTCLWLLKVKAANLSFQHSSFPYRKRWGSKAARKWIPTASIQQINEHSPKSSSTAMSWHSLLLLCKVMHGTWRCQSYKFCSCWNFCVLRKQRLVFPPIERCF